MRIGDAQMGLKRFNSSCKESHISSLHSRIWISSSSQKPLSKRSSCTITTEEVIEDRGVQWLDSCISEVIVVSLDLWAQIVVRLVNE